MKTITVTFPNKSMTAKEIMGDNSFNGGKLLYNIDWYKNEKFFTAEKTRTGTWEIAVELSHKNKTWQECKEILDGEDAQMLNLAEALYLVKNYPEYRKMLEGHNYTWLSSKTAAGSVSCVGYFDGSGLCVDSWNGDRDGNVGVGCSRKISGTPESFESLKLRNKNLETKIEKVTKLAEDIIDIISSE